jgi:sugar (pentulose or hexulose) kinase
VETTEGAAYGAALLAAVGAGWHPSVQAATASAVVTRVVASPGADVTTYSDLHARFRALYPALAGEFDQAPGGSSSGGRRAAKARYSSRS